MQCAQLVSIIITALSLIIMLGSIKPLIILCLMCLALCWQTFQLLKCTQHVAGKQYFIISWQALLVLRLVLLASIKSLLNI